MTTTVVTPSGCDFDQVPSIGIERAEFDIEGMVEGCVAQLEARQKECNGLAADFEIFECFDGLVGDAQLMLEETMGVVAQVPEVDAFLHPPEGLIGADSWSRELGDVQKAFDDSVVAFCDGLIQNYSLTVSASGRALADGNCRVDLIQAQLTFLAGHSLLG